MALFLSIISIALLVISIIQFVRRKKKNIPFKIPVLLLVGAIALFIISTEMSNREIKQAEKEELERYETEKELEEAAEEENQVNKEEIKEIRLKDIDEYKRIASDGIGKDDTLENIKLDENNIIINISLGNPEPLTYKDLAIARYSSITDGLLEEIGALENIIIDFNGIGLITMNTSEKRTNEYGGNYFDLKIIEERLK